MQPKVTGGVTLRWCVPLLLLFSAACVAPRSPEERQRLWEERLADRALLRTDPCSEVAIKRDVRWFDIDAGALEVANAFHHVMIDPNRRFGLIHVIRTPGTVGRPFHLGERFQGRYGIEDKFQLHGALLDRVLEVVDNRFGSDYGLITTLSMGDPYNLVMKYEYLDGSPIAGSSTFTVEAIEHGWSRMTQIFEYQETEESFVSFFGTEGLKLHGEVVDSQAKQTAEFLHASIAASSISP